MTTTCRTYVHLLKHLQENPSNPKALNERDDSGIWHSVSTADFLRDIRSLALGLRALGLQRGDKVAIFAPASPRWTIADIAIAIAGGISVPIFTTISEENFLYEIRETRSKIILVEGELEHTFIKRYEKMFTTVIALDRASSQDPSLKTLSQAQKLGDELDMQDVCLYQDMLSSIRPTDICTIFYTSGSTGVPKGVELTHENLICGAEFEVFDLDSANDRYLSVLPLEHVFGHCFNLWILHKRISIFYSHDHKRLADICREVKPTILAVVPRLLERVYAKMLERVHSASWFKRTLGEFAFHIASKPPSLLFNLLRPLLDLLVYKKLRQALGGSVNLCISGGAALSHYLHHFYSAIGIPIYEGWGLTEGCPLTINTPKHRKMGSVGKILPYHEIKISEEGEILVKGPIVMHGYYDNTEKTALALDADGYLHTGDMGRVDSEGYLYLIGRIKELYKSSTGEKIAPVPIEQAIAKHPLVDMALVVAEGRKFASVLIFPAFETVERLKVSHGKSALSNEEFLLTPYVKKELSNILEEVNSHLNHPEQIRAYKFVLEPLSIQSGDLTPSMKIRRNPVIAKYASLIDEMYNEEVDHG